MAGRPHDLGPRQDGGALMLPGADRMIWDRRGTAAR